MKMAARSCSASLILRVIVVFSLVKWLTVNVSICAYSDKVHNVTVNRVQCWEDVIVITKASISSHVAVLNGKGYRMVTRLQEGPSRQKIRLSNSTLSLTMLMLALAGDVQLNPGPSNSREFNMFYQNVRSVSSSLIKFNTVLSDVQYHCICVTESWLNSSVGDSEILSDKYVTFRRDRETVHKDKYYGGGVFVSVLASLGPISRPDLAGDWECQVVKASLAPGRAAYIVCAYLPPSETKTRIADLRATLNRTSAVANPQDVIVLCGDFNISQLAWAADEHGTLQPVAKQFSETVALFLEAICENNMNQVCHFPTRGNNFLDLIFVSDNVDSRISCDEAEPAAKSDHLAVELSFSLPKSSQPQPVQKKVFLWNKGDYKLMRKMLATVPWSWIGECKSVEESLELFYDFLYATIKDCVPVRNIRVHKFPAWYDCELIEKLKEKERARRKYRISSQTADYIQYSFIRKQFKSLQISKYRDYVSSLESNLTEKPKLFWNFINNKRKSTRLPSTMIRGNREISSKAGILNTFSDVFSNYHSPSVSCDTPFSTVCDFVLGGNVNTSVDEVTEILKRTDVNKSGGPDNIPGIVLKQCAAQLAVPLTVILNKSFHSGIFPSLWKQAFVVPVFKKGDRSNFDNYRPVVLLSLLSKVAERILHNRLYRSFRQYIRNEQHGFVQRRSTASNLAVYTDFISDALDKGLQVDAVYTDLSKAFDSVQHSALLTKLSGYGIHGSMLSWMKSYLTNRECFVKSDGLISCSYFPSSGVPQGSILGPLLFIIFINDLPSVLKSSECLLYADDLKMFRAINSSLDCKLLQSDINIMSEWCKKWHLNVNPSKCNVISFSRKRIPDIEEYTFGANKLMRVNSVNDLGVVFSNFNGLSFKEHVNFIVNKSLRFLGFLKRNCKDFKSERTMKSIYCAFLRPSLEYCCEIWSPAQRYLADSLERVQIRFLKWVSLRCFGQYMPTCSYALVCEQLSLDSLAMRRKCARGLLVHKCLTGRIDCPKLLELIPLHVPLRRTRQMSTFSVPKCRTVARSGSWLLQSLRTLNSIEGVDVFCSTTTEVRRALMRLRDL